MITTIQIDNELKTKLDSLKVHHRESYNELISRIIGNCKKEDIDKESLLETLEILSDPDFMRELSESLKESGGVSLEEFEKNL